MNNHILLNFEAIYNDLKEIIIIVDKFGTILNLNNTALETLGYRGEEIIHKNISETCCDKALDNIITDSSQVLNMILISKYRKLIPVSGKASTIKIDDSSIILLKLSNTDEKVYKNIYCKGPEGYPMAIKDINGKYMFVNDVFEKQYKKNKEDVINKFDDDLWDEKLSHKYRSEDLYVIRTKNTYVSYDSYVEGDEIYNYEVSKSPILNDNNQVVAVVCNRRDISKNVKLRNELIVQNEQLSVIYNIINNASSKINIESLFSSLRKDFKTLLNISCFSVYLHNQDLDKLEYCVSYGDSRDFFTSLFNTDVSKNQMKEVFKSKIPITITNSGLILDEDNKFTDNMLCYPLVNNNKCFGVINFKCGYEECIHVWDDKFMSLVCKNISILLQNAIMYDKLEKNLKIEKEANELINLYFETTIDFFCIIDENKYIKNVGKQMLKTLGYSEEEMYSKPYDNFLHQDDRHIIIKDIKRINKCEISEFIIRIICKNGKYRTIHWNIKFLKDKGIYVCSGRDLTYEEEMAQKKKMVEESFQLEKLKSEFLSSISHELRTPIAIIYGSILNMETSLKNNNKYLPKKVCEYINSVKKNTFRLLRLFNNILDITNVNAGFISLNLKTHNIVKVIDDISLSVSELLSDQNVSLIFDTDIEERYINVDADKMERVMLNLISNSVKYSKKDVKTEILVRVYEDERKLYISIKDNGIGIDSAHISKIFDRFSQINDCMTRDAEGSGIGLYLVKTLLQMQEADITVNSTKGEGSEFIIEFSIFEEFQADYFDEDFEEDFSVKIENFDMEFSDIAY